MLGTAAFVYTRDSESLRLLRGRQEETMAVVRAAALGHLAGRRGGPGGSSTPRP